MFGLGWVWLFCSPGPFCLAIAAVVCLLLPLFAVAAGYGVQPPACSCFVALRVRPSGCAGCCCWPCVLAALLMPGSCAFILVWIGLGFCSCSTFGCLLFLAVSLGCFSFCDCQMYVICFVGIRFPSLGMSFDGHGILLLGSPPWFVNSFPLLIQF